MIALEPGIRRSDIAWLNGCCILARREVLQDLRGFDEAFFLYQAETDLCLRARRAGFSLGWLREALVYHLHRQSQREISEYEYSRRLFDGSAVFWKKHYSPRDVLEMAQFQHTAAGILLVAGRPLQQLGVLPPELHSERLRARRDVCRDLVASLKSAGVVAPGPARIVSRQSRLAQEWVRQRRFPLDDY